MDIEDPEIEEQGNLYVDQDEESGLWSWTFCPFIGKRLISSHSSRPIYQDEDEALAEGRKEVRMLLGLEVDHGC